MPSVRFGREIQQQKVKYRSNLLRLNFIKVKFLPNTTSKLQPLDLGISSWATETCLCALL